jgi:hypothetical protein
MIPIRAHGASYAKNEYGTLGLLNGIIRANDTWTMEVFLLLLFVAGLASLAVKQNSKIKVLDSRLRPIKDAEKYAEVTRKRANARLAEAVHEADEYTTRSQQSADANLAEAAEEAKANLAEAAEEAKALLAGALQKRKELIEEIKSLQQETIIAKRDLEIASTALGLRSEEAHLLEVGYYEPAYPFDDLPRYEKELKIIRDKQKEMIRLDGENGNKNAAAYVSGHDDSISYQGNSRDIAKILKNILNLMLRAFNGECDAFIARANYRNIEAMRRRIESSFDQINKLAESWGCVINYKYLVSRQAELQLVFEYEEQKQKEKEEQAQIREQMREEQKAAREAEKARQQAEKEEAEYQEMLDRAMMEAESASEEGKAALSSKIEELQRRISEIEEKKRALSQAMLTRAGHVYILSNVGSFGENVYKIGMTRRLVPMDRVNELGDASVPFPFDVHALISTNDAPALESSLHKHFSEKRVNLENSRKEFFRVSIDEVKIELEQLKDGLGIESELQLTLVAEAKQYRISEARRKGLEGGS